MGTELSTRRRSARASQRIGDRAGWFLLALSMVTTAAVVHLLPLQSRDAALGQPAHPDHATAMLNSVWTLGAALFLYLMHGGFGFFEAGMTRRESTVTTLAHNLMVLAVTVLVYWAVGFAVMYGDGSSWIGMHGFFPTLLGDSAAGFEGLRARPVPLVVAFALALSFADTPATLVAGSGAERLRLSAFMTLTVLIGGLLFPLVGRAVWAGGVLARLPVPFYDSGAATVQLCGGLCALVTCRLLGPRAGRFNADGSANRLPSSSMPLVFLGAFILWMGFLGFNAGLSMTAGPSMALVLVNTVMGTAAGATAALASVWLLRGKGSLRAAINGMLTAAVAVTSISAVAEPWAAVVTGLVAGIVSPLAIAGVAWLQLDDPTEYLTMNVVGGVLGTLAVGIFASPEVARRFGAAMQPVAGLVYGGWGQLASQLVGLAVITTLVVPPVLVVVATLRRFDLLRISAEEERHGSDRSSHGENAYEGFAWAPVEPDDPG